MNTTYKNTKNGEVLHLQVNPNDVNVQVTDDRTWDMCVYHFKNKAEIEDFITKLQIAKEVLE